MRTKLLIGIVLAVTLAASLLFWSRHRDQGKPAEPFVAKWTKPAVTSLPRPLPIPAKMQTMTIGPLPTREQSPVTAASDWDAIQTVVDVSANYRDRLIAVKSLSRHLSDEDVAALREFLLKTESLDLEQRGHVLKNDVMNVLCDQDPPLPGLDDVLAKVYRDRKQDDVIRDYAVQHLATYYEQMMGQRNASRTLQTTQKILWEAINEPAGSIAGTALLALNRLSQEYSKDFDQQKIASAALKMAGNPIAGEASQITAYQICARLRVREALPIVLRAATDGESVSLQLSAIAALGQLGGKDQVPYLNGILTGAEVRLKPAAEYALTQITKRQNPSSTQN